MIVYLTTSIADKQKQWLPNYVSFRGSEATVGISSTKEGYFYAPINIVYLEFSMLIGLFSFGTALLEIATGLTALAMTVVRGSLLRLSYC